MSDEALRDGKPLRGQELLTAIVAGEVVVGDDRVPRWTKPPTPATVPPTNGTNGTVSHLRSADGCTPYGRRALEDECTIVAGTSEGSRNDALNKAAFRMGRLVPEHLDAATVRAELEHAGRSCGLPQSEINLVLRDDTTAAINQGQTAPREARPLEPVPEPTVVDLDAIRAAVASGGEESGTDVTDAVRERFPILDWRDLYESDDEDEEWIVEPLLPARRLVALFSPPKVGKSLLMLEVAVAVARGTEVLGVTPDRPRRVLYVDFENDPRGDIRERLQAMGRDWPELEQLCYLSYPNLAKLDTHDGAAELMAIVATYECEVVVIDTISRAVKGEENENDTWLSFYRNTGLALKQAKVTCIRLDHTGKDHDKGMRGGSAKYGDVDLVWKLSRLTEASYRLECTDHRLPVPTDNIVIERVEHPYLMHRIEGTGWTAARDTKVAEIIRALDEAEIPRDTGKPRAKQVLRDLNIRAGSSAIEQAVRERKMRPITLMDAGDQQ